MSGSSAQFRARNQLPVDSTKTERAQVSNYVKICSVATSYFFESTVLFFHNFKILYFFCTFFRPCTFFVLFFHQFG